MPHRDVDIVIKDETQMFRVLKFLIYRMRTLDGNKDTAIPYLEQLNKGSLGSFKKEKGYESIKKSREHKIIQMNEDYLADSVLFKYKIMKLRAKLSFMAFKEGKTILELFLVAILKSHKDLVAEGVI